LKASKHHVWKLSISNAGPEAQYFTWSV